MNEEHVRTWFLRRLGVRLGPRSGAYVLRRLNAAAGPLAVMGGDARTGVPVRRLIDPALISKELRDPECGLPHVGQ